MPVGPSPVSTAQFAQARADLLAQPGFGPARRQALTALTDSWLRGVFDASGAQDIGCTLVAVGGYGRRELAPASDLDLVLAHPKGVPAAAAAAVAERIWYPVWDAGWRLDHSVRTPDQARRMAVEDLRVLLGLLDARTVAGDDEVTARIRSAVLTDWRTSAPRRLPDLRAWVDERIAGSGELAHLLEPDLKHSHGGLRDLTVLRALTAAWLISPSPQALAPAQRTLLDTRDALHVVTGRATDRLTQQEQAAVAEVLGHADRDALLRAVCAAGRTIGVISTQAWATVQRHVNRPAPRLRRRAPRTPLADGVVVQDEEVVLASRARPEQDPVLVLRVAAAAAQAGLPLSSHTVDHLAQDCAPLPVPWPRSARENLVSLLGAGRPMIPVWEALDQAGLIARILPGWDAVRSAPQRNPVHRFTVDRHLIETAVAAASHTRKVGRPDLLLVGALLHDIGKGRRGDHTRIGVDLVGDLGPHLGFDAADTRILVDLVAHHLLLPEVATRRDLDDPAVIAAVADVVGSVEVLHLLHWLSVADADATGPGAWSTWKANLIELLVARTEAMLREGAVPEIDQQPQFPAHLWEGQDVQILLEPHAAPEFAVTIAAADGPGLLSRCAGVLALNRLTVREAVSRSSAGRAVIRWTVLPHFGEPPPWQSLAADLRRAVAGGLDLAGRIGERELAYAPTLTAPASVEIVPAASSRATVLEVRAHDRPGLLYRVTAALAGAGVNVDAAKVCTLGSEVVDVFFLTDAAGLPLSPGRSAAAADAVKAALAAG